MNWKTTLATLGLTVAIAGCNSSGSDNSSDSSDAATRTIDFNYQVTSLFQQTVNDTTSRAIESDDYTPRSSMARSFTAADIMVGELQVTPVSGGASQTFTWSIYLDDTTWSVESNLSIDLDPGAYDFDLLLEKDDYQYAASTMYVVVDGTNDVPMTISPVIGDLIVNVSAVEELEDFKFQYDVSELAGLTNPQIGVQVDGGAEQIFTINPSTGLSDAYLNLTDGNHTLELKLYDANVQVGKSIDAQESQLIVAGQDINMDLVPLHAETQLILTEAGGDANVTVNLPELVADEVGGINNLQTTFSVVGAKNPLQETSLTFSAVTGGYQANFVLSDLQYDDLTVDIKFDEIDSGENIGRCIGTWTLSTLSQTLNCNIELRRRAVIGGSLLAVLGINVLNQDSEPVEGVVIKDQNDTILGITGSGAWGTKGYLKTYLKAGDYTLTAEDQVNNLKGSEAKTLSVLDVENVLITLTDVLDDGLTRTGNYGNIALIGTNGLTESSYSASHSYFLDSPSGAFDGWDFDNVINLDADEKENRGAWGTYDGNAMDQWIQVDFNMPVNVTGIRMITSQSKWLDKKPKDITVQVSSDGITYEDISSFTSDSSLLEEEFSFQGNSLERRFLRVFIHNVHNNTNAVWLDELEIYSN